MADTSDKRGADRDPTRGDAETGRDERPTPKPKGAPETPLTQQIGRFAVGVTAVLFGIFAVANAQSVEFDYLFGSGEIPLILVLIGAFVLGGLTAWFATWRSSRRSPRDEERSGKRS